MKNIQRSRTRRKGNRGSALLVSLMVIVGLSLLGLGFVAISETESAIAKNEQNALQTQSIAEAGAMLVVEWFQNPTWGIANAAMPANNSTNPNLAAIKTVRVSGAYTGVYKPDPNTMLLDKPYRQPAGTDADRFWGTEDKADLIINRTTDKTTIDNFNNLILGPNPEDKLSGEITEIKIYAPPITGGTVVNGFWTGALERFGYATIKVTATQFRNPNLSDTGTPSKTDPSNILAQHAVRLVVGEIPLPIPAGPIQSNTSISFGGDFIVHWGNETSTGTLQNKRDAQTIPWANAYEHAHFEHGYEPGSSISRITLTSAGSGYTAAQNNTAITIAAPPAGGTCGAPQATATMQVAGGSVTGITITNKGCNYTNTPGQAGWGPPVTIPAPAGGGSTATAIANIGAEIWPISGSQFDEADYFHEMLGKQFDDPWFGSRSVGDNLQDGTGPPSPANAQLYPYAYTATEGTGGSEGSHFFQWQSVNLYPWQRLVIFPPINYTFWKRATRQSRGLKGLYYFGYDSATGNFKKDNNGTAKGMCTWVNTKTNNLGAGVYFFDTKNSINPQNSQGGILTGAENWNSSCLGGSFLMVGFIYINASAYGTTGAGSSESNIPEAAFPGEPFRDTGYGRWSTGAADPSGLGTGNWDKSCGESSPGANDGQICISGTGNAQWDYQDLNGNGKFDVITMPAPKWNSYDPGAVPHAAGSTWVVKTWKSNDQAKKDYGAPCTIPGTNPATDCSEPHEPYLNFIYPTSRGSNVQVGWEANGGDTRRPKKTGVTCTPTSPQTDCTSNAFDMDGGVVDDMSSLLDGILYNEGNYDSQGNADYFGSLLIQGSVTGTGTPDIWFDEKLLKGTWAPPGMPRVMVFSEQTDELSQQ